MALSVSFLACSDEWDDHYDASLAPSDQSLLQVVKSHSNLSDFVEVLNATHVFTNNKITKVTYADLLDADQSLTVWAPVNGTFNKDSLLAECQTAKGDSMVGQHFIANHISHFLYTMGDKTNSNVKMLNNKQLPLGSTTLGTIPVSSGNYNLPANNGLLHLLDGCKPYAYNLYEAVTSLDRYRFIGDYIKSFEQMELDENASVQSGIVDGVKVYSDSVMLLKNILFNAFGEINAEDSSFVMLLPTEQQWKEVYDEALGYFNYGSVEKADSIQKYWTYRKLMSDLFINRNMQHALRDSVFTTSYNKLNPEYHVYYKPLSAGGLLSDNYIADTLACSNGAIYHLSSWPFTPSQLYFQPVEVEGEREANILKYSDCTFNYRMANADSISGGYLDIMPQTASSNWAVDFEVGNTLAGTYDVCLILLPKTAYNVNSRDFKPNKFNSSLTYTELDGTQTTVQFTEELTNNPYQVDTVKLGTVTIPVCNYAQEEATVTLHLECSITRRQTNYSREMFLDQIYLKPTKKDE